MMKILLTPGARAFFGLLQDDPDQAPAKEKAQGQAGQNLQPCGKGYLLHLLGLPVAIEPGNHIF
jgi:hypothetical protein